MRVVGTSGLKSAYAAARRNKTRSLAANEPQSEGKLLRACASYRLTEAGEQEWQGSGRRILFLPHSSDAIGSYRLERTWCSR